MGWSVNIPGQVSVTKSGSSNSVTTGALLTYTITITNLGTEIIDDIIIISSPGILPAPTLAKTPR
jgi:hypothetical protein